ncbi:MAG: MAPEG family protein [Pseudomonadota bacterium]
MITPLYAGILTLLFVALSIRVIGARRSARIALGDGGASTVLRRMRVHSNFAEYVPLALILMLMMELQDAPALVLHALGIALVGGRTLHAYGVSQEPEPMRLRVAGMATTFTVLIASAIGNMTLAIWV